MKKNITYGCLIGLLTNCLLNFLFSIYIKDNHYHVFDIYLAAYHSSELLALLIQSVFFSLVSGFTFQIYENESYSILKQNVLHFLISLGCSIIYIFISTPGLYYPIRLTTYFGVLTILHIIIYIYQLSLWYIDYRFLKNKIRKNNEWR